MLVLSSTTDKVQVTTSTAASIDYITTYVDKDNTAPPNGPIILPDNKSGNIAAASVVDVTGSPASGHQFVITELEFINRDASLTCALTVDHIKAGGTARREFSVTLQIGEKMTRDKNGVWFVYDAAGGVKTAVVAPLSVSVLTSGSAATYTTKPGCRAILVELVGGGGAGGGGATVASGGGVGGGGGAGSYTKKLFSPPSATYTYTIGAGGTAGTAGNNPGNNGADTTFGSLTAKGGTGGAGMASGTTVLTSLGGAGGVAGSGGDTNSPGQPGEYSSRLSGTVGNSGAGAASELGPGANSINAQGTGTSAAANSGGGGSGGVTLNAGASTAGGAGGSGVVVVTEFF